TVLQLSAADVDLAVVGRRAAAAARGRHAVLDRTPQVSGGVIFLDDVHVGRRGNVAGADAAADDVDLAVDHARKRMVARGRHRTALRPRVGGRVKHLVT